MHLPFRKMDTRRLHAPEIKQLVRVLRNDSNSHVNLKDSTADKATVSAIKQLPRRLRAKLLSSHGSLCHTHKGLDHHLIDDIWAWMKFELETAIGRFIYPLIMSGTLSKEDEHQIRQLEPVVEMILPGWTLAASAPPGKRPIHTGTNWAYQQNGCPACILSRIGSDTKVLFALYAGIYGHLTLRNSSVKKSKRLRTIRYWMRTHPGGEDAAEDAYEFGAKLKALRGDAKEVLRQCGQSVRYRRSSTKGPPLTAYHFPDNHTEIALDVLNPYTPKGSTTTSATTSATTFSLDVLGPHNPKDRTATPTLDISDPPNPKHQDTPTLPDPTPNPTPPPAAKQHTSTDPPHDPTSEIDALAPLPSPRALTRSAKTLTSHRSAPTRHDSVLSLHAPRPRSSVYSTATSVFSYNANATSPRGERAFDPLETPAERLDKYRKALAPSWAAETPPADDVASEAGTEDMFNFRGFLLPKPSRASLYGGFGDEGEGKEGDRFEMCDFTPLPSPEAELGEKVWAELVPGGLAVGKGE